MNEINELKNVIEREREREREREEWENEGRLEREAPNRCFSL
jgi:hypothetical protein